MLWSTLSNIFSFQSESGSNTGTKRQTRKQRPRSMRGQDEPLGIAKYLSPWESTMVNIQSILIWENPIKSFIVVVLSNIIYWYLTTCDVKFYFLIALSASVLFFHQQWVNVIWPEISVPKPQTEKEEWTPIHPDVLSAPEVSRYLNKMWSFMQHKFKQLVLLRRKQPGWFCFTMLVFFSLFWIIGRFIPGVILLNLLLIIITCGPAFAKRFIPPSVFVWVEHLTTYIFVNKNDSHQSLENDLEEFLPEETSPDVQLALGIPFTTQEPKEVNEGRTGKKGKGKQKSKGRLGKKSANSSTSTEVGNSFIAGLSEKDFPSLDEPVEKTIEESDLIPEIVPQQTKENVPEGEKIHFVPKHFGDSSDEEEEFTVGLAFNRSAATSTSPTQVTIPPSFSATAASLVINQLIGGDSTDNSILNSIGHQIVSAMNPQPPPPPPQDDPDSPSHSSELASLEDEFEFISEDEIQDI